VSVTDARIGTELAGYRILSLLGQGGMSVVYLAEHTGLKRKVALKLLPPSLAEDARFRDRFIRESQLAASLDHPNVIPIYEAGEGGGQLFIAMRYVEGTDLKSLLRDEGRLEPERALPILAQVAGALDAAHARDLVHRDVKPANVLIARGTDPRGREHVYLSDFGLTKRASSESGITGTGQFVGTLDYAAPEQFEGKPLDARADVYSLGCVLFECLTGSPPFTKEQDAALMYAHLMEEPPAASRARPQLPPAIDPVIRRAMAKRPVDRYDTAGEVVDAAGAALGISLPDRPVVLRRRRGRAGRRLIAAATAAVVIAATVVGVLVATQGGGRSGAGASLPANRIDRIDPAAGVVSSTLPAGDTPAAIASGEGAIWVASFGDQTLWRIDPATGHHVSLRLGGAPTGVAVGEGSVWVSEGFDGLVEEIAPDAVHVVRSVKVPTGTQGIAIGSGAVWASNYYSDRVLRIDPATGKYSEIPVGKGPRGVAVGEGAVWVANALDHTVSRIDPATGRVTDCCIGLRFAPYSLTVGAGALWVTHLLDNEVSRIDPASGNAVTIAVGTGPVGIAAGPGAVWVADSRSGQASMIDPRRGRVVRTVRLGGSPEGVAIAPDGEVWVTDHPV
jgi:DNA-binding beta-propeller fold protein YncE/tRNA A-37 threonylcarbamoyl transferase component Bud32